MVIIFGNFWKIGKYVFWREKMLVNHLLGKVLKDKWGLKCYHTFLFNYHSGDSCVCGSCSSI